MSGVYGVKETKELVKFAIELGEAFDVALSDKKFDMSELGLLIAPLMQVGPAFEGLDKVASELKELSESEQLEVVEFVKTELDLKSDNVETVIESALELGVKIAGFVKLFKKSEAPTA